MAKLNHEMTKRVFALTSEDELKALVQEEGFDWNLVSRMAIDETLKKFYNRSTPSANKAKVIEILTGAMNGVVVEDDSESKFMASEAEIAAKELDMDPATRMEGIRTAALEAIKSSKDKWYLYVKKAVRDPILKKLRATADDLKQACKDNPDMCLVKDVDNVLYLSLRTDECLQMIAGYKGNEVVI